MGKQILKGFTMVMLLVGLAFASAVASNAQTSHGLKANVPFEFMVGDKMLPAGEYTINTIRVGSSALAIRGQEETAIRLSNVIEALKAPEKGKLVFHRYGQSYFLSEVWSAGETAGRQLLKSRGERSIESQLAAIPSKSNRSSYEIVEIVAMVR